MTIQQNKTVTAQTLKVDEDILVVARDKFFEKEVWQGLKEVDLKEYIDIIEKNKEFLPRSVMEQDFNYKQIIPYLIFSFEDKFFLMQRQSKSSEQRLKNKYNLKILTLLQAHG